MKKTLTMFLITFLAFACTSPDGGGTTPQADTVATDAGTVQVEMIDGVQVASIEAGKDGFTPGRIELQPRVPTRLLFKRTSAESCAETVSIPEFGIEKRPLPVGEEVAVQFTPQQSGDFTFVCGMDMQKGALVVRG